MADVRALPRAPRPRPLLAAAAAVALAVAAAIAAASIGPWLAEQPGAGRPKGAAQQSAATPLPAFVSYGAPIRDTLELNRMGHRGPTPMVLDLRTGALTEHGGIGGQAGADEDRRQLALPDGRVVCVCGRRDVEGDVRTLTVDVRITDARGRVLRSIPLGAFTGTGDPARPSAGWDGVVTSATLSPEGSTLFVGHVARTPPGWTVGLTLVDLGAGSVVQSVPLATDVPLAAVEVLPPEVDLAPDGGHAVISWSAWSLDGAEHVREYRLATVKGGFLGSPVAFYAGPGSLSEPACSWTDGHFATNDTYFAVCWSDGGASRPWLRRVALDGTPLGDTDLPGEAFGWGDVIDPSSGTLYGWNANTRRASRIDLATGAVEAVSAAPNDDETAAGPMAALRGVAGAIARWAVPSVSAKVLVEPALALSPDGDRLYALGVGDGSRDANGWVASDGIWVFDTATLDLLDHWAPTAHYASIAVSDDGRFVYVAAAPGLNADGTQADLEASVTVHDALTGEVRVVARELGTQPLVFAIEDRR